MASKTQHLNDLGLLKALPKFLVTGVQYEVVMGSLAYGVATDDSDMDVYGFAIPPRDEVFPHLRGHIEGFDEPIKAFSQFQQHHIWDESALGGKGREYDVTLYSIVKYFRLLADCNPNIIDSLFVPRHCVVYSSAIGEQVRESRHIFLHKGCWAKFKGYAYAQMHKMRTKVPEGKRAKLVEDFGYDVKFAYHIVRLLNEVEQILTEGSLELDRNAEQLKAIRRGDWELAQVEAFFVEKEKQLEAQYLKCSLPVKADMPTIKQLLLSCLEQHYGSMNDCIAVPGKERKALQDIQSILDTVK